MNLSAEAKRRPGRARLDDLGFSLIDADDRISVLPRRASRDWVIAVLNARTRRM
jgi:hypothetical protein